MKGTVYFRKWSKMPWWSRTYHLRNLRLDEAAYDQSLSDISKLVDFCDQKFKEWNLRTKAKRATIIDPRTSKHIDPDPQYFFIHKFFERYPTMRGIYVSYDLAELRREKTSTMSTLTDLLKVFNQKYKSGLSKETATSEVLARVDERLQLSLDELKETSELAKKFSAVPFFDFALLDKLKESELKTKRLRRDADFKELVDGRLLEELETFRPNYRIVSDSFDEKMEELDRDNLDDNISFKAIEQERKEGRNFIERSEGLLWKYYQDVIVRDKLDGMSDKDMFMLVERTPRALQKHFAPLIRICEAENIKLSANGSVDFSQATNRKIVEQLRAKEELVKYALMLKDLDFGAVHREKLRQEASQLSEALRAHNESTSLELKEFKQKSIAEILEKLKLPRSDVDEILQFIYFERKNKPEDFEGTPLYDKSLTAQDFLAEKTRRIDWNNDLRDSNYERNLKLEGKWLKSRALNLALSEESLQPTIEQLVDTVRKLRRVKVLIDKEAFQKASKLYFAEHSEINFEKEQIELEKLKDYLQISSDVFTRNPFEEQELHKVRASLKPKIIRHDLHDPFTAVNPLEMDPNDAIELREAEHIFWEAKRDKFFAEHQAEALEAGAPVKVRQIAIMNSTPEEIKNYKKNNPHILDPDNDPFIQYLEQKNRRSNKGSKAASGKKEK